MFKSFKIVIIWKLKTCVVVRSMPISVCTGVSQMRKYIMYRTHCSIVCFWGDSPQWARHPHSRGFWITHNDAPQSVGLVWTCDQLFAETSTWQLTTLITNIYAPGGIRIHYLSRRTAADPRLRLCGHWDRQCSVLPPPNYSSSYTAYIEVRLTQLTFLLLAANEAYSDLGRLSLPVGRSHSGTPHSVWLRHPQAHHTR